ncbi:glycosyltransferase involved in cell wall biosynthesis [Amycolatopsis bartoniae]|nr:glycosyltransferase involved in cell wall biosynthesis [Amycolatopsis bartoniae]
MKPEPSVDVILPCLDEAAALPGVLARIPEGYRAIVVDNGSTDGSPAIAAAHGAKVAHEPRRGYGAAVHTGLELATAEVVCVLDADGSLDGAELPALVAQVAPRTLVVGARRPVRGEARPRRARASGGAWAVLPRRRGRPVTDGDPVRAGDRVPSVTDLAPVRRGLWSRPARAGGGAWAVLPRRRERRDTSGDPVRRDMRPWPARAGNGALTALFRREGLPVTDGDPVRRAVRPPAVAALLRREDLPVTDGRPVRPGVWPWHARAGNRVLAALLRRRGVVVTDIGPVRVGRRVDLLALGVRDRAFGYPLEVLLRAGAAGWRIIELPVSYGPRAAGTKSKVSGSVRGTMRAIRDMAGVLR